MADLTIEGMPDALLARVAAQAAAHGRCVNSELIVLVARSLAPGFQVSGETREAAHQEPGPPARSGPRRVRVGWGADEARTTAAREL